MENINRKQIALIVGTFVFLTIIVGIVFLLVNQAPQKQSGQLAPVQRKASPITYTKKIAIKEATSEAGCIEPCPQKVEKQPTSTTSITASSTPVPTEIILAQNLGAGEESTKSGIGGGQTSPTASVSATTQPTTSATQSATTVPQSGYIGYTILFGLVSFALILIAFVL